MVDKAVCVHKKFDLVISKQFKGKD